MTRSCLLVAAASTLAASLSACGGTTKPTAVVKEATPAVMKPERKPKKKKVIPPLCVVQGEQAVIGMSNVEDELVSFCVSDGRGDPQCYSVDLASKKYEKLGRPPLPQRASLAPPVARLQSTAKEVRVCAGEEAKGCKVLKPRIKKPENPIEASINTQGTIVAMLTGDAEAGKGIAEVWSVAKKKKTAKIAYAKGEYRCGSAWVLDELVYVSASNCMSPAAHGALYSAKGKKVADIGGSKDFGTYGAPPVQLGDHRWAFLSETGGVIAIHDTKTGKLEKTIDLLALWSGAGEAADATGGNPGESALLRGADGKLLVVSGSPHAGNIGVVDLESGNVDVIMSNPCGPAAASDEGDDEGEGDGDGDEGEGDGDGDGSDDDSGAGAAAGSEPASELQ